MSEDRPRSRVQIMREQRRRQQMATRWLMIGGIALLAVVAAILLIRTPPTTKTPTESVPELSTVEIPPPTLPDIVTAAPAEYPQADDNAMGDPAAPIKITEYSDYQCPYCQRFALQTEPQLVEAYVKTGKVYFVYRSMGDWIGPESLDAVNAAYCAGEQNQYWPYHATIFANWNGENQGAFSKDRLLLMGENLGLEMGSFRTCVESGKFTDRAKQDQTDGFAAGVEGTPYFLITYTVNGEPKQRSLPGAYPFEDFQKEIEAALAEMGLTQ